MRATDLGLKHPREIFGAPYYNPQITYQGSSLKLTGKDYVKTRSKSFSSSRFYHPQLANNSTTLLVGPGRYVSELGTIKDELRKHTTFVYKEDCVSSLNPEQYMMVGNSKIFCPEVFSPNQKRSSTPSVETAKSIDYTVGYSTSTTKYLKSVMGTLMKNISNNESQNGSDSTSMSRNPSSVGPLSARGDGSKSSKRRTKNNSLLGSNSVQNSSLLGGNAASNNESANISHDLATTRPNSCKNTPLKNSSNTDSNKKLTPHNRTQSMSSPKIKPTISKSSSQVSIISVQSPEKPIAVGQIDLNKFTQSIKPIKELGKILSTSTEGSNCLTNGKEKLQDSSRKPDTPSTTASTPKRLLVDIPISTKSQLHLEITAKNPFASFQNIQKVGASKEKVTVKKRLI